MGQTMIVAVAGSVALLACGPGGRVAQPTQSAPPPLADENEAEAVRRIQPGVLHGLMLAGEMRIAPDEALAAQLASRDQHEPLAVRIEVCLDVEGQATHEVTRASSLPAFDRAALAVVERWRFRTYRDGGTPLAVCSGAEFRHGTVPATGPWPARSMEEDALPEPALELPRPTRVTRAVPHRQRTLDPTAGVALAWACRQAGVIAAPELALIQSSGDARVDRELVERRMVVPIDEPAGASPACMMWTAIVRRTPAPAAAPAVGTEPPADRNLPPVAFDAKRIAGDPQIFPSDEVKTMMQADGRTQFIVPVKVCVDTGGFVSGVKLLRSSGYPGYDADLANGVASWRYSPFTVDGVPAPACGMVNFSYRQKPADDFW